MSTATAHLKSEHELIEKTLQAFQNVAETLHAESGGDIHHRTDLWPLLEYLVDVVMLRHEEKEETLLLPALSLHGERWNDGPLASTRREHRHGRNLTRSLRQALHQAQDWDAEDARHFSAVAQEWIEFNREHMRREEIHLFPLAEKQLDLAASQKLAEGFARIDIEIDLMPGSQDLKSQGEAFLSKFGFVR
jgi:hemerythrin-like domain-containing protein